jgi:hypothetical protein
VHAGSSHIWRVQPYCSASNANHDIQATAASYTGAAQLGIPDATSKSYGNYVNYSQSVDTVTDNSWVVMMATDASGRATGAGSNTTLRGSILGGGAGLFVDSNGAVSPAGVSNVAS